MLKKLRFQQKLNAVFYSFDKKKAFGVCAFYKFDNYGNSNQRDFRVRIKDIEKLDFVFGVLSHSLFFREVGNKAQNMEDLI